MLPNNTPAILRFMGYVSGEDFSVVKPSDSDRELRWRHLDPEPTEQEIIDAGNDLTTVNGQVFSEWYAENGGDATLTLRKKASDLLDKVNDSEALLRALVLVMVDEINILRAEHSLADRTAAQVRTAIKNKLNSGDADG